MDIILERAGTEKKGVLFRLLQYSLFEESISDQNRMGEDGLFAYPWFEDYFTEEEREAYLNWPKGSSPCIYSTIRPAGCPHPASGRVKYNKRSELLYFFYILK